MNLYLKYLRIGLRIGQSFFVGLFLMTAACGENSSTNEGTVFDPPAWVDGLGGADGSGGVDTGGSGAGTIVDPAIRGVKASISGVAESFIVSEVNVVENSTQVNRVLQATGTADDGNTLITLIWTVAITVAPPATLPMVAQASGSLNEAIFAYSETATGPPNAITSVTVGELDLEKWNDIQVRGTFSADIVLADGTNRSISDGTIDVRFNQ